MYLVLDPAPYMGSLYAGSTISALLSAVMCTVVSLARWSESNTPMTVNQAVAECRSVSLTMVT